MAAIHIDESAEPSTIWTMYSHYVQSNTCTVLYALLVYDAMHTIQNALRYVYNVYTFEQQLFIHSFIHYHFLNHDFIHEIDPM